MRAPEGSGRATGGAGTAVEQYETELHQFQYRQEEVLLEQQLHSVQRQELERQQQEQESIHLKLIQTNQNQNQFQQRLQEKKRRQLRLQQQLEKEDKQFQSQEQAQQEQQERLEVLEQHLTRQKNQPQSITTRASGAAGGTGAHTTHSPEKNAPPAGSAETLKECQQDQLLQAHVELVKQRQKQQEEQRELLQQRQRILRETTQQAQLQEELQALHANYHEQELELAVRQQQYQAKHEEQVKLNKHNDGKNRSNASRRSIRRHYSKS